MFRRIVLVLGLWGLGSLPAVAQEMPSWAAPLELSTNAPQGPPPVPEPPIIVEAPVGDGLALLALLGVGYAALRLRRRDPRSAFPL